MPGVLYNDITVRSGGGATLAASPYVVGNVTVQSGGVLNDGCEALTGPGSFTLAAGGALETGTGLPATVRALGFSSGFNLALTNSVTATAVATFSRGVLLSGANTLALGPTATLTEEENGYVTGTVQTSRPLTTAGTPETFGGLGLTLTPSGATLPGSTLVRRVTGTALSGQGASTSVKRYCDIEPAVTSGLDMAPALAVRQDERNGISANRLRLFRSEDAGAGSPCRPPSAPRGPAAINPPPTPPAWPACAASRAGPWAMSAPRCRWS